MIWSTERTEHRILVKFKLQTRSLASAQAWDAPSLSLTPPPWRGMPVTITWISTTSASIPKANEDHDPQQVKFMNGFCRKCRDMWSDISPIWRTQKAQRGVIEHDLEVPQLEVSSTSSWGTSKSPINGPSHNLKITFGCLLLVKAISIRFGFRGRDICYIWAQPAFQSHSTPTKYCVHPHGTVPPVPTVNEEDQ